MGSPLRRYERAGFALAEVVIAGIVGTLVVSAVLTLVKTSVTYAAQSEQRAELASFTALVTDQISCSNTFDATVNPDVAANPTFFADCASSFLPTKLYGKAAPGAAAPLIVSNDPQNPTRVGAWTIRAWCKGDRILVEAAQPTTATSLTEANSALFRRDPVQSKRALDWISITDASPRRVIKSASALCRPQFLSLSAPTPTPTPSTPCPGCYAATDCPDGNCVLVSAPLTAGADLPVPCAGSFSLVHWKGDVTCPAGTQLVSGGVNCQVPPAPGMLGGGMMLTAQPDPTAPFSHFQVDCCGARPHGRPDASPGYTTATSPGFAETWGEPGLGPVYALCKKI